MVPAFYLDDRKGRTVEESSDVLRTTSLTTWCRERPKRPNWPTPERPFLVRSERRAENLGLLVRIVERTAHENGPDEAECLERRPTTSRAGRLGVAHG